MTAGDLRAVVAGFGSRGPDVTGDDVVGPADVAAVAGAVGDVCE